MDKDVTLKNDSGDSLYPITRAINVFTSTNEDVESVLNSKQRRLTAGTNITIDENNVISAVGSSFTAGSGINISSDGVISLAYELATEADIDKIL